MTRRMLGFTETEQETPVKRPSEERARDFGEIYREYAADKAEDVDGQ